MIATLALIVASHAPQTAQDKSQWTSISLPGLCVEPVPAPYVARLLRGQHLILQGDILEREAPSQPAVLPVRSLLDWLQEDGRKGARDLRFQPGAPPILVRGEAGDLAQLEKRVQELELAGANLEIELRAWLTPGVTATGTHPARAEFERAVGAQAAWGESRVRSGQTVIFGQRSEQSFLGAWSSEVASSSGVAEPRLLRAMLGQTLHLVAARTQGGARVRLTGLLDLSELGTVTLIDPGTPDLGVIQEPSVHALQVGFAGSVESGGLLAVSIEGAPLAQANWTLWIEARSRADASSGTLRVIDLAWLETPALPLPPVSAGAGLDGVASEDGSTTALMEPLSAATLAQLIEETRSRGASTSRSPVLWMPNLLIVPRDDAPAQGEIDSLLDAAGRARGAENEVLVTHGTLRVRAPTAAGSSLRVLATHERTLVTGYSVEIATEAWMPNPKVERVLDGAWIQGQSRGGRLLFAGWSASSDVTAQLSREEARLGRMQLLKRDFRGERIALDREHPKAEIVPARGASPALAVEFVVR